MTFRGQIFGLIVTAALAASVALPLALVAPPAALAVDACQPLQPGAVLRGTVINVVDGDTFTVASGGCRVTIRDGGFDAPERGQPGADEARAVLARLTLGRAVLCTVGEGARDPSRWRSHGRVIAVCRIEGRATGDLLRAEGVPEGGR